MKGLLITTLVSLAISQSYAATECPAVDGPLPVYIPNPLDCGTYYQCVRGKPLLLQCPVGTHWSTIVNRCDFPENAKCEETGAKSTSRPTEAPVSQDPPKKPDGCPAENGPEDVLLPNPDDCGSFYKCLNGIPYLVKCPPNQEWSIELNRCDWPEVAQCSESGNETNEPIRDPETHPEDPPRTPDGCPAENGPEDVLLPNPDDCGSFYKCLNGIPYLIKCPPNQEWSIELNRCDWPEIAQCSESGNETNEPIRDPETHPEDPPKTPDGCPAENGPEDVLLPNPDDCGSFYKCLNGIPYLIKCPPNQEWSIELNRCDWPEIAQCSESGNETNEPIREPETHPEDPPKTPDGCPAENGPEDVLLPNSDDCGSFYKCLNGIPYLIQCPSALEWSVKLNRCDWPEIANCSV